MIMDGRRIGFDIKYNNQYISTEIAPFITELSFSDNFVGTPDSISISLGDRDRNWMGSWMPKKGAALVISLLISKDWGQAISSTRKLGYFEVDNLSVTGPPHKVTVHGLSIPETSSLRGEEKSRSWQNTNLKKVVQDIASKNKLNVYFDAQETPTYERLDQTKETDYDFLKRVCNDAGFALKIANNSISVFDEVKYETSTIVDILERTDPRVKSYSGDDTFDNLYRSCTVKYTDPKKKKTLTYTFTPSNPPQTNKVLVVNEEVTSQASAMRMAKKHLRSANKEGTKVSLKMTGFLTYYAGQTINIKGFGQFDGKYIITSISGRVGKGSETSLELRKCLEGY